MPIRLASFAVLALMFGAGIYGISNLPPNLPPGIIAPREPILYAITPEEHIAGMAGEEEPGKKMLFVFEDEAIRCLWSPDNTRPISATFFTATGKKLSSIVLPPKDTAPHCSEVPAQYILETIL